MWTATVGVRDVPTASLGERLVGRAASAARPLFRPEGATLYTSWSDGVIVWDARGERRLWVAVGD